MYKATGKLNKELW